MNRMAFLHPTSVINHSLEVLVLRPELVGAGPVPWVGCPPDTSFGFHLRSISKPDQHRKDIIQQELLGTDML